MILAKMSEKDIKCCVCQKQFNATYNLAKHARKYHAEQVSLIIPKKTYKYQCTQCHKGYSLLKHLNSHKKTHCNQNIISSDVSSASIYTHPECPICKLAAPKENLITHFEVEHDIKCVTQTIEFSSFEEFSTWKTGLENNTKSKYIAERGHQCSKDGSRIIKYCCHRSGKYVASGKGLRHLKTQGSKKIGFCPARLKLIIDKNNHCKVSFMDRHVGHDENYLGHLFLTLAERKSLANKMALKIPFSQILDDVRDSVVVGSQLEQIHLLTRKDLLNIERSFHLQSTVVRHANDAVSEDAWVKQRESSGSVLLYKPQDEHNLVFSEGPNASEVSGIVTSLTHNEIAHTRDSDEQLAREKQKLIDNFTQLMGSVTSMEQVDAAKKCAFL